MRATIAATAALAAAATLAGCGSAPKPRGGPPPMPVPHRAEAGSAREAVANISAASGTLVSGRIQLRAEAGGVRLAGTLGGLTRNGAHVLQVHAKGDCGAVDASSAGPYFDASGQGPAGGSPDRIVADADGVARVDQLVRGAVLGGGALNDIDGRALVVLGAPSGASGARIACGVIRTAAPMVPGPGGTPVRPPPPRPAG